MAQAFAPFSFLSGTAQCGAPVFVRLRSGLQLAQSQTSCECHRACASLKVFVSDGNPSHWHAKGSVVEESRTLSFARHAMRRALFSASNARAAMLRHAGETRSTFSSDVLPEPHLRATPPRERHIEQNAVLTHRVRI